jgi:hypothetical protein
MANDGFKNEIEETLRRNRQRIRVSKSLVAQMEEREHETAALLRRPPEKPPSS